MERGPGPLPSTRSRTILTETPDIRNSASNTGLWRIQLSTTVRIRNGRHWQGIMHKINALPFLGAHWYGRRSAVESYTFSLADAHAKLQAIQAIQPAHPITIDQPSVAPEQDPNPLIVKPRPRVGQIPNANPQGGLILRPALPIPGGPTELGQATGPPRWYPEISGSILGAGRASDFFSERLRQHVFIESNPRPIASASHSHLPAAAAVAARPRLDRRISFSTHRCFGHAQLPTDVSHRGTRLRLAECVDDLPSVNLDRFMAPSVRIARRNGILL